MCQEALEEFGEEGGGDKRAAAEAAAQRAQRERDEEAGARHAAYRAFLDGQRISQRPRRPPPPVVAPLPPGLRVVVLGAGVAGLKAAGLLQRAGAEVVVLEARDRWGDGSHLTCLTAAAGLFHHTGAGHRPAHCCCAAPLVLVCRVGGRVHTVRLGGGAGGAPTVAVDLGATAIHGERRAAHRPHGAIMGRAVIAC